MISNHATEIQCSLSEWLTWSHWSPCSKTCGNGEQTRSRKCSEQDSECPDHPCIGLEKDIRMCNMGDCCVGEYQYK